VDPARGLFVRAELVSTSHATEARTLLTEKVSTGRPVIRALSFGFEALLSTDYGSPESVRAWWSKVGYRPDARDRARLDKCRGVRVIEEVRLYEVSPVTIPSNEDAMITESRWTPATSPTRTARKRTARDRQSEDLRLSRALASLDI
jgi:phage head maturation protease